MRKILIIIFIVSLTFLFITIWFSPIIREGGIKTYQSNFLKFSINVPSNFHINERTLEIILEKNKGKIVVSRDSTNFINLDDYLNDLNSKNKTIVLKEESKSIKNYQVKRRLIKSPNESLEYRILIGNSVYLFTTDSEDLYDDLDKIVSTFTYLP